MGSDKIFMFDNPAAGESAGIMSMIPALLQNKGNDTGGKKKNEKKIRKEKIG